MNESDFKKLIRHSDKIDDVLNYIICFAAILGGLFWGLKAFQVISNDFDFKNNLIASFCLLIIGCYGVWRIPKDYNVSIINSNKPLIEKKEIIELYLLTLNIKSRAVLNHLYKVKYRNRFGISVNLAIGFNETCFFVNAKGADDFGAKGIIDFGLTKRALKKAVRFITKATNN